MASRLLAFLGRCPCLRRLVGRRSSSAPRLGPASDAECVGDKTLPAFALRGLRKPSADVLNQIAKALRISAEVLYVRAGILEPSETSQVRDAIITDTAITERQKQILLDIYASFAQQNESIQEECPTHDSD